MQNTRLPLLVLALLLSTAAGGECLADDCEPIDLLDQPTDSGELPGWKSFSEDPKSKTGDVWTLTADGVLICAGTPRGYIYTEKDYTNFVLSFEWSWPKAKPGKGGVLIRTTAPHKIWPKSLEAQINAPDAGDFWGLVGYSLKGPDERMKVLQSDQFGTLTNLKKTADAEKSPGQWNSYKITAQGTTVTLEINGRQVNQATGCKATPGKICLTAEGNPIQFRNVRLVPIGNAK